MKKQLMIAALCVLTVSFTGCGKENEIQKDNDVNVGGNEIIVSPLPEESGKPEETIIPSESPEQSKLPEIVELPEVKPSKTPVASVEPSIEPTLSPDIIISKPETPENTETPEPDIEDFEDENVLDAELDKIVNSIVENSKIERYALFNAMISSDSSSTYVGLKSDEYTASIEKGMANESMMMPSNYSFCLLKVKEGQNVSELKQKIFDNCNTRKWVCMSTEYVLVADSGNYIVLAMGQQGECKAIYDALKAQFGTVGESLEREVIE